MRPLSESINHNIERISFLVKNKILSRSFYNSRTGNIVANVSTSLVIKFFNLLLSFLMVPITLDYLDKTRYGLWAALSSILAWFFIFDIGIGNGLRNKYTELKATGRTEQIKAYVSTAYFIFSVIAIVIIIVFAILNLFIDWSKLLNAPANMHQELSETVLIVFITMCLNFVFRLLNTILAADMKNAVCDGLSLLSQLITFAGILLLSRFTTPTILKYALLYTGSNLCVTFIASVVLYAGRYRQISPGIRYINLKLWNELISTGMKFFFIQIAGIILFQSTSLIISNLLGPESVTDYTITLRYFSMISMFFVMMVQPLWTGYGDAYHKEDFDWIRRTFRMLIRIWIVTVGGLLLMLLIQKPVFHLWLNNKIMVDWSLSSMFVVYFILNMLGTIYNPFINATAKLRLQMISLSIFVPLFIPMAVYFVKVLHMGPKGVLLSIILFQALPAAIITPIQCYKILNHAGGIWEK